MGLGTSFGLMNPLILSSFMSRVVPGLSGATQRAGEEIVELATKETQSRLYPGHGLLTGALRNSYRGKAIAQGTERVEIEFGSDLYYAPFVEFKWGGSRAHFFPAMNEVEKQVPEIFKKHIDGVLHI